MNRSKLVNILKILWQWIKTHKLITIIILFLFYALIEYMRLPDREDIRSLKKQTPKVTALMDARREDANDDGKKYFIKQQTIPLNQISIHLKHAVIAAEDGAFYEHEGVDWYEVKESLKKDIAKGRFARGASTITQQLAKNIYLSISKNPVRKIKEIFIAWMMEDELSKSRILELYLNLIEWGDGIFGIESASLIYFGKHASDLSREEAASLAAVIPSPLKHKPNVESRYLKYRRKIVLARMSARGW
ncbi:MAG: monofunctional biosynthetic peptidoglycan transglycosylase [Ignavibacteriales bacterium]|nr:monofunctional biosynthetic peptidoglycan transglycosylase [Ignavibacteriales bacterium]